MKAPRPTIRRAKELRARMSPPEVVLWQVLRGKRMAGSHFRKQHPIGSYVLDFYCDRARLCVEVDGYGHSRADAARHDERRDDWLRRQDIFVLRIDAAMIRREMPTVLDMIWSTVETRAPSGSLRSPPPPMGEE